MDESNTKQESELICRVCLKQSSNLFMIFDQIFVTNENNDDGCSTTAPSKNWISLSKILEACTGYHVRRSDELPQHLCEKCKVSAISAFNFKQQAELAYQKLNSALVKKIDLLDSSNHQCLVQQGTQTDKFSMHPCELCDDQFFDIPNLREHYSLKHTDEMKKQSETKCTKCDKVFFRKYHLQRHLQNVHKVQQQSQSLESSTSDSNSLYLIEPEVQLKIEDEEATNDKDDKQRPESFQPDSSRDEIQIEDDSDNETEISNIHSCSSCDRTFDNRQELLGHSLEEHSQQENNKKILLDEPEIDLNENKLGVSVDDNTNNSLHWHDVLKTEVGFISDGNGEEETVTNPIITDNEDSTFGFTKAEQEISIKSEPMDSESDVTEPQFRIKDVGKLRGVVYKKLTSDTDGEEVEEDVLMTKSSISMKKRRSSKKPPQKSKTKSRKPTLTSSSTETTSSKHENRCKECQRVFARHCHLRRHMLTHLDEKQHACPHCDKRFARSDHFKAHVNNVHGKRDNKCNQCKCAFNRAEDLARHIQTRHGEEPDAHKIHGCEFCGKKFASVKYLGKHKLLHTDRLYACKHCDATFKDRKLFRGHEKSHNSVERNYLCSVCGESFMRNDYLIVHMRRHNGEKPYKCQYCGKGFPRATDVKMHERYHTGTKPNVCSLCGKGFHRAYNLTIHMRTHTGERPFKCDQCPKSFAQSNDLKAHIRRHTGERFKCSECDAAFLQLYNLRQHALNTHGIVMESTTGRLQKFPPAHQQQVEIQQQQQQLLSPPQLIQQNAQHQQLILQQENSPNASTTSNIVATTTTTTAISQQQILVQQPQQQPSHIINVIPSTPQLQHIQNQATNFGFNFPQFPFSIIPKQNQQQQMLDAVHPQISPPSL